jgi:hypothetical protein
LENSENALECNCVREVKMAKEDETESTHNEFQSSEEALIDNSNKMLLLRQLGSPYPLENDTRTEEANTN